MSWKADMEAKSVKILGQYELDLLEAQGAHEMAKKKAFDTSE